LLGRFGQSQDLSVREFRVGGPTGRPALLAYLFEAADQQILDNHVLRPLMEPGAEAALAGARPLDAVRQSLASVHNTQVVTTLDATVDAILEGNAALMLDGTPGALTFTVNAYPNRSIGKPETEHAVRGSREGFTESITTSLGLLRKRVRHPNFRVKFFRVGNLTRTRVALIYLEGLTNPELLQTIRARLEALEIDSVLDSHTLEAFIRDHPYTPFPTIRSTERPDEAARVLLSGKALLLVDNSPFILTIPGIFVDFYQTMEDYAFGYWAASMVRLLRLVGWASTLFLPALYVALIAVNPEMVPNELALTIASAREGLPFPPIIEVLIIETLIELIREASLRLPQPLGTTIGVVGGVVVGQAIVAAGVISPLMIIFAAVTMIASFTTPVMEMGVPWRILKWFLVILANMFGLLGMIIGTALIFAHLISLSSFGVPYVSPFSPTQTRGLADTVVRGPLFTFRRRPAHLRPLSTEQIQPYEQPAEHPDLYKAQQAESKEPRKS
jgi:spore germination protein KA